MKLVNLTPHEINIGGRVILPSGTVTRCEEITVRVGSFDGIELVQKEYGEVIDLPDLEWNTLYIVSAMVRMAVPGRMDLASPGDLVRDENGKIIGYKNLVINN